VYDLLPRCKSFWCWTLSIQSLVSQAGTTDVTGDGLRLMQKLAIFHPLTMKQGYASNAGPKPTKLTIAYSYTWLLWMEFWGNALIQQQSTCWFRKIMFLHLISNEQVSEFCRTWQAASWYSLFITRGFSAPVKLDMTMPQQTYCYWCRADLMVSNRWSGCATNWPLNELNTSWSKQSIDGETLSREFSVSTWL